jgi:hypothetical protein
MRSLSIFAVALALLVFYLVAVNRGLDLDLSLFWIAILLLCTVPIYQLSRFDVDSGSWEKIILLEIILITLAIRLIWIVPFSSALREVDPHYDYYAAKMVMNYGWSSSLELPLLEKTHATLEWPILYILAAMESNTTGIDLFQLVKYFPLVYGPFSLPLFYLFAKAAYNDTRTGLFASYGMSALYMYASWDSKFVRESLATGLFWLVLYVVLRASGTRKLEFRILGIVGVVALVLCHSLTTMMLILFGITMVASSWLFGSSLVRHFDRRLGRHTDNLRYFDSSLLMLLGFITLAQMWFVGNWILIAFADLVSSLALTSYGGVHAFKLLSTRIAISVYGNIAFAIVAGCIFLYHLRRTKCAHVFSDFALGIWGFVVMALTVLLLSVQALANYIEVTRLQKFGWPFILIVAAHGLSTSRLTKKYLGLFFIIFVILQVFTIPPDFYTRSIGPDYQAGRIRGYYLPEEYAAVNWFNSSNTVVGDLVVFELLGGLRQVPVQDVGRFYSDGQLNFPSNYLFFYRTEDCQNMLPVKTPLQITSVLTLRHEALDSVANRLYQNPDVILYGFFDSTSVRTNEALGVVQGQQCPLT